MFRCLGFNQVDSVDKVYKVDNVETPDVSS